MNGTKKSKLILIAMLMTIVIILGVVLVKNKFNTSDIIKSDEKSSFRDSVKMLIETLDEKKLSDGNFDPTIINNDNVESILNIPSENYSDITIVERENFIYISIVGTGKWADLVACGTYDNLKVVESLSGECNEDITPDDITPPVITILGDNPINLSAGVEYIDGGATATDDVDGDLTSKIAVDSNVNYKVPGTYDVTYSVADESGNSYTSTRTVKVIDKTAPTVIFETNGSSTYAKTRNTTVNIKDTYGNVDSNSLRYLWNKSATQPNETSFKTSFRNGQVINTPSNVTGSYYLWVLAKDNAGNTAIIRTKVFNIDNTKPILTLLGNDNIEINLGSKYVDLGATVTDNIDELITVIKIGNVNPSVVGEYAVTYSATDSSGNMAIPITRNVNVVDFSYDKIKGVNKPNLVTGMTPIKWDGTSWVDTTTSDTDWYNYNTTDKKWANARTADGSMWVWVPRYIYKIPTSNWHTSTAGTIDIQFSRGIDDNWNKDVIDDINLDTTANASNGTWTNHPAFTFGDTELTGFWISKFEASSSNQSAEDGGGNVTNLKVKSLPNVLSWRGIETNNIFTVTRSMETDNTYGWGTSGNGIDTHMMKNIEWGAVAYLAQSVYGKNTEIWANNSSVIITGCAGSSVYAAQYAGCENTYNTSDGMQASTTGNIYGIYDTSGGSLECTAAYVDNGYTNLINESNLMIADVKYKDVYIVANPDTESGNYALAISHKGDAVYETSSSGTEAAAWNTDHSTMPRLDMPWFVRGGHYWSDINAGSFFFYIHSGVMGGGVGFRPVLAVSMEL
jgi:hypothetical protein